MKKGSMKFKLNMCIVEATIGYLVWHQLIKKHSEIQNTLVILLPDNNSDCNDFAFKYIEQLLKNVRKDNAVIITTKDNVLKPNKLSSNSIINTIIFTKRKIDCLIRYATLYNFDNRLYIASLERPYGRFGHRIVGLKGLEYEDVFAIGVYRLLDY